MQLKLVFILIDTSEYSIETPVYSILYFVRRYRDYRCTDRYQRVFDRNAGFIWKGIPWISTEIARAMPFKVYQKLGSGTLAGLDKWLLEDSNQPDEVQDRINRR